MTDDGEKCVCVYVREGYSDKHREVGGELGEGHSKWGCVVGQ